MKLLRKILEIVLVLLLPMGVRAQNASVVEKELTVAERNAAQGFNDTIDRSAPDFVKAYYVVTQPGGALYSVYGHACLHLVCPAFGLDYYFSYESEDAARKILTFLAGNLKMGMIALTPEQYLSPYQQEGRGVLEYEILLPIEYKRELWRILDQHLAEGIYLPYDYEARGCAYSCHKLLEEALGNTPIHYAPWKPENLRTRREMLYDAGHTYFPWNTWLILTMIGIDADFALPPQEKTVIPVDLAEVWMKAKVDNTPIISSTPVESLPSAITYTKPWFTPLLVAFILLFLTILGWVFNKSFADYITLTISTALGAFLTYLVVFSSLPCTSWNWLIIPFNILPAICWKWRKYWALPYSAICAIWLIAMLVYPHRLIDPAFIPLTLAWIFVLLKQSQWLISKIPTFRK